MYRKIEFSESQLADIKSGFEGGEPISRIGRRQGVSHTTIYWLAYKNGWNNSRRKPDKRLGSLDWQKEYLGRKFGRLTIKSFAKRYRTERVYLCICDCGNECEARISQLKNGHKRSCGCLAVEVRKIKRKTSSLGLSIGEVNLRDVFAGLAMVIEMIHERSFHERSCGCLAVEVRKSETMAERCYDVADAMLFARQDTVNK